MDVVNFSGKGVGLGSLASSQSVSFRAGSNVEFGGTVGGVGGAGGVPGAAGGAAGGAADAYALHEPRKGRDFSNPMYDAVTRAAANGDPEPPLREYTRPALGSHCTRFFKQMLR